MFRMGILASIRSIYKSLNLIGCMITASHNPVEDNGCKLIDPNGDMLDEAWETYATELVNSKYNFSLLLLLNSYFYLNRFLAI
jgi:phosphoacetylglucosamine mutase